MDLDYIDKGSAKSVVENMWKIVDGIDETFGKGYAKDHPGLVGDMLKAASIDYFGTVIHYNLEDIKELISNFIPDKEEE